MNEKEARADFLHEYLKDTPHLFALDNGRAVSVRGTGKEILLMWAVMTQQICEQIGADSVKELNEMALMASIEHLGDLLKGLANREED